MIEVDDELVQVAETTIDPYKVKELFLTEEEMAAEKLEEEADQKSDEIVEEEKTEEDKTEEGKPEEGKTEDDKNDENKGSEVDSDIRDNPKEEEKVTEEGDKQKTEGVPEGVSTVPEIPSEGKLLTSGAGIYKVTISDIDEGTVAYVGPESSALSTIKIPATVTVDGVTYKVTAIDDYAFKNNKKLKKITIGSNIITIGKQAFYGCKKLKKITIKTTKLKKSKVGSKAFKGTPKNVQVKVPKTKNNLYKEMLIKKG
ncbi:MAG: leucine-rich repeat protein, partial [Lachnospiraceae bacterium]|nr:leucine-rich repeat protein [Lachnospiraceae bacterium]